ncbi:MAG TPA: SDR family NAD(P)-dependent oxidoreductase [bacterium]|nr:SDR family NAD(P)-dependent oxidoreductase [bacterium]
MALTAVIAGVGPGLGESLAKKFAGEGCRVAMFARSKNYLNQLAEDRRSNGQQALSVPADITKPDQVQAAFQEVRGEYGEVDILINHASYARWQGIQNLPAEEFETAWRVTAYGAFLCCKQVVPGMIEKGSGTILFTGATSSIRGAAGSVGFASAKFAVRGMAQSMARELGPKGIHVAHVIIDGQIDTPRVRAMNPDRPEHTFLNPDAIAENYWNLVNQDKTTWTLELDLRPHVEQF